MMSKWQALWGSGRMAGRDGRHDKEEELLRRALELAEHDHVQDLELGILILDLVDCMEKQNKQEEAQRYFERARFILVENAKKLGVFEGSRQELSEGR